MPSRRLLIFEDPRNGKKPIDLELKDLISRVKELGYHIEIEADAKDFVAEKGYDIQYGARPLKRAIQTYIEDNVCELLLSDTLSEGDIILIRKEDEKIFAIKKESTTEENEEKTFNQVEENVSNKAEESASIEI